MKKPRIPALALAGKVKILGDIVSPIVDEDDWDFEFPFERARQITPAASQEFRAALAESPLPWRIESSDRSNIIKDKLTSETDGR
ncbi:hypothetical protein [Chamaesiphon sp. VAR_48_metabat_135_sub]|uniref:hypothetical protein n=1 Tax=Chamaesiphon sp. VAR_48_metabat_135_sub TaxID=2964699 RepID=UPI00286CC9AE|nr:hypothetical protein [Chamaesiphon sp. VAR_48_metabat_135_sub]